MRFPLLVVLACAVLASAVSCASGRSNEVPFELTSPVFSDGGEIPTRHTCEGEDVSPPLSWSAPPEGTRSLVLVVEDPDAPDPHESRVSWVHWVVIDLPTASGSLPEGVAADALPGEARMGTNEWKRSDYGGPCPPSGRHRYYHNLYALDVELPSLASPTRAELAQAMAGHVLGEAVLVGTYARPGS